MLAQTCGAVFCLRTLNLHRFFRGFELMSIDLGFY